MQIQYKHSLEDGTRTLKPLSSAREKKFPKPEENKALKEEVTERNYPPLRPSSSFLLLLFPLRLPSLPSPGSFLPPCPTTMSYVRSHESGGQEDFA